MFVSSFATSREFSKVISFHLSPRSPILCECISLNTNERHPVFPPDPACDVAGSAGPDRHGSHRLSVHHTRRCRGEIHLSQEVTYCPLSRDHEILKGFFLGHRSKFQEKLHSLFASLSSSFPSLQTAHVFWSTELRF